MKVLKLVTNAGVMTVRADAITHASCVAYLDGSTKARIFIGEGPGYEVQNTSYDEFVELWASALAD